MSTMEGPTSEILNDSPIPIDCSKLNHSILFSPSNDESSYERSPLITGPKPVLLASTPKPKKQKDDEKQFRDSYTLPLLTDQHQIQNNGQHNRVIHRSLMLDNSDIDDLTHSNGQTINSNSSPLARRFSADDKRNLPKTYVVLHQPSHNYQFFNQRSERKSTVNDHINQKQIRRIERLNFDKMENEIYHKEHINSNGRRGLQKWIICLIVGILTGLCMYIITIAIQAILSLLILDQTRYLLQHSSWFMATLYFLGCNLLCGLISALCVIYIEKAAAGSGIPEVKAYLNGSWIPHLFNIRTLFVKLFGVVFAVSGSFVVGKEGPMVHAGAIIANGVSRGRSRTLGFDCGLGYTFRNDNDARDFISCGAAAGVSAAFGAPIGGMLFALEEVSSFWKGSLTWRSFFCAAVSAFFLDILLSCFDNNEKGTCGEFTRIGLITFNAHSNEDQSQLSEYTTLQLVAFLIIGVFGGLIGSVFNYINIQLCYFRKKIFYPKHPKLYPIVDVLFAAFLTTMLIMVLPQYIYPDCRQSVDCDDVSCKDIVNENQFTCDESGHYNGLSALLLGERERIIKYLFHYDSAAFFEPIQVLLSCFAYFILAVYTYGLSIPSGLFIPLILIGSSFGWFFGFYWEEYVVGVDDDINDKLNVYALMGASALLGGSTRMTISLTAIIMEISNDIYYLLPIMLVVMCSKWIGDRFNAAIYESHVALSEIPYLEHSLPKWIPSYLCAKDVMTKNVMCLPVICPLRVLNRYLRDTNKAHNAFPIIDCDPMQKKISENYNKSDGKFVGIMLRWHIMILLNKRNFAELDELHKLKLLCQNDLTDSEYKNKYIDSYQKDFGISLHELNHCFVDFSPYMHLSPFTVQVYTPIYRVYTLFRGLGLRHLVVLDANNKFVDGIITAKNLSESALEHIVNKLYAVLLDENSDTNVDDYICHRLHSMNQSAVCKKYKVSNRFLNSSASIHETANDRAPSISNFSIAENEKDMKLTFDEHQEDKDKQQATEMNDELLQGRNNDVE